MVKYPDGYIKFDAFDTAINHMLAGNDDIRLLFVGSPGTGKSQLARLIMNALLDKHMESTGIKPDVQIKSASELYRRYLALTGSTASDKIDQIDSLIKILAMQYVIIDDFGNEINSGASNCFMAELFSYQYDRIVYAERRKPINTIITTNFGSKELAKLYGDRIIDRIYETYTVFQFNNDSFRRNKLKIINN